MATRRIPIRADLLAFTFNIVLDDVSVIFNFRWNSRMERWIMDLLDPASDPILMGIPVLEDTSMIDRYIDDRIPPGILLALDTTKSGNQPDLDNFGEDVILQYEEV